MIENPARLYLYKLSLLNAPCFNQNNYIDADCLAYKDLNSLFDLMPTSDVSYIGKSWPLTNRTNGWFNIDGIGDYKEKVTYIPQMHAGAFHSAWSHS